MNILLRRLHMLTKKTKEIVDFSDTITYVYGPVGKGKSTLARLIDFCFGGQLENTPAIQQEFVSVTLYLKIGLYECTIERSADDTTSVRLTWSASESDQGCINVPIKAGPTPIIPETMIYNLSDMIYHFCGVEPIKVHQRTQDAESPLIRLGFRDLWRYSYLEQMHLDSSFFKFEDAFKGRKSQDALRFFTGLYSERLSQIESELMRSVDSQRAKREAVLQIRGFMGKFSLGSESEIIAEIVETEEQLFRTKQNRSVLFNRRSIEIHPTDSLRDEIVELGNEISQQKSAIEDARDILEEQQRLHSELLTAKIKIERISQASMLFNDVHFECCPACGTTIHSSFESNGCYLCGKVVTDHDDLPKIDEEATRRDLNLRIDELADSIWRRKKELQVSETKLEQLLAYKLRLDARLQESLLNYDSAIIDEIRQNERITATLEEHIASLSKLRLMPQAINQLEDEAGALQGEIDRLRSELGSERERLVRADDVIHTIADEFKRILISVKYPGVYEDDQVTIDPRNWKVEIVHENTSWSFWDTGSGGKKTLFNVCYALALHAVAIKKNLPVPSLLIIDSPTKNISEDENPELVASLYAEIYHLAAECRGKLQMLLIDSDFVPPQIEVPDMIIRHMAGTEGAPSLISYYVGP